MYYKCKYLRSIRYFSIVFFSFLWKIFEETRKFLFLFFGGELFALWSILLVGVIFLAEQKLHKRGRKIVKNHSKRVFVNDSRPLFLFGRYIYIHIYSLVWFTFCYFGNEIFVGDTKICFLIQYWGKVARREMRPKKGEL